MSAQQPVQTELLMRHHQLQSRLATLKIENEEVSEGLMALGPGEGKALGSAALFWVLGLQLVSLQYLLPCFDLHFFGCV